jgi:FkbM family methyltransferase
MRVADPKPQAALPRHWWRLKRSLGRRWREWRLPRGFERLGTKYGGWWLFAPAVGREPLLVDCGLGVDISFPRAFLKRFGGSVFGIDPNPAALEYARAHCPPGMEVHAGAFWTRGGEELEFHLPRPLAELPTGADGVSGSLLPSHRYTGAARLKVRTLSLADVLARTGRQECDVLKLDIEGAEYDVLDALCAGGEMRRVRQLMVEFHHHCTERTLEDTVACIAAVEARGFALMHTEDRNCVLLRKD